MDVNRGHPIHRIADKSGFLRTTHIIESSNCQNDFPLKKYVLPVRMKSKQNEQKKITSKNSEHYSFNNNSNRCARWKKNCYDSWFDIIGEYIDVPTKNYFLALWKMICLSRGFNWILAQLKFLNLKLNVSKSTVILNCMRRFRTIFENRSKWCFKEFSGFLAEFWQLY